MRTSGDDRGALRLQTISILLVVLAVVGVFAYDAVHVMATRVGTQTDAQNAAFAASTSFHNHGNVQLAYQAAVAYVDSTGNDEKVLTKNFSVTSDGTVTLTLRRPVQTVVFRRIGPLKHYTVVVETSSSNSDGD
ncbi:MAG TPA: hypothetical protein VME70_05295 [Mycobacteriales bacterium]|nr:hypothetical protein [Mycobacteriales bacterium]